MDSKQIAVALRSDPNTTTLANMNDLVFAIQCEHRTHQANIIRNMIFVLKELSGSPADMRNQGAVDACSKIKELDLFIPYI